MKIKHDRSYWRLSSEKELIEAARDSDNELAIALGERLAKMCRDTSDIDDLEAELQDMQYELSSLQERINDALAELAGED